MAVIGLGLIGGSALQAFARQGHRVLGYDADPATRAVARTRAALLPAGARWQVPGGLREAVTDADIVLLAVPLPAVARVLDGLAEAGYAGLVTDVTSVKAPIRDLAGPFRFVGGHPMAGRETSGFAAADPDLFTGCAWVLCLEPGSTKLADWLVLADLVTRLGARAVPATAAEHDATVAEISHVPHLLASALAEGAAGNPLAGTLAAGSFRDGTRVAASPPDLIAAMCGGNAGAVLVALDRVRAALDGARAALDGARGDADPRAAIAALRSWLEPGCAARAGWPPQPGEPRELPADVEILLRLGRAGGWITAVAPDRQTVTAVLPT